MKRTTALHSLSALIAVAAVGTWLGTGREGYTRWPNAKLARSDAPTLAAEDELLAEIGLETGQEQAAEPHIQSRFAFGLVPGGLDAQHMPSVATAGALAMTLSGSALVWWACRGRVPRASTSPGS